MSIIGNPIMAGAGGPAASIFVKGLSQTDTVTATNGSKTLTGKWTQRLNPAAHGLPNGYTELEYIEGTGTQYINTGYNHQLNDEIYAKFKITQLHEYDRLIGVASSSSYGCVPITQLNGYFDICYYDWYRPRTVACTTNTLYDFYASLNNNRQEYTIDGASMVSTLTSSTAVELPYFIFAVNFDGVPSYGYGYESDNEVSNKCCSAKLYRLAINNNSQKIRDYVPCKRNSDGVIGLYDLVTKAFFGNAGTGEFVAGPEIPQTIDGFLIDKIKDYGTWTVTATDGEQTATQDVLVDVITEYEIEMLYSKLWLYRDGDECESVTGGWKATGTGTVTKNDTYMSIVSKEDNTTTTVKTVNELSLEGYTKLFIDAYGTRTSYPSVSNIEVKLGDTMILQSFTYNQGRHTESVDLSLGGTQKLSLGSGNGRTSNIYNVWLEQGR